MRPGEMFVGVILETKAEQQLAIDSLRASYETIDKHVMPDDASERLAQMRTIRKMGGEIALNDCELQYIEQTLEQQTAQYRPITLKVCNIQGGASVLSFELPTLEELRRRWYTRRFKQNHALSRRIVDNVVSKGTETPYA